MWVIVAVNLAFGDMPKLTVLPGPEFQTKAQCIDASRVRADLNGQKGSIEFSMCVPKGSVQIGQ
jgi:hypothetical protein